MKRICLLVMCVAFLVSGAALAMADEVKLGWQSSGVANMAGYFLPVKLLLSTNKPDGIKAAPTNLAAPLYGKLQLGPAESPTTFFVILDEPEGRPSRLFVDANGNGDLTDDPPTEWNRHSYGPGSPLVAYDGGANVQVPYASGKEKLHLMMIRFDKNDPNRAPIKNDLIFFRDYGRAGDVPLGGKTYHALLLDEAAAGDFRPRERTDTPLVNLFLDLNNSGKFERYESFDVTKPFNIGGTTYEIAGMTASGATFQIVKSTQTVGETRPRLDLSAGNKAPYFEVKTSDGATVHFPADYKGKIVMLDFWATWCPPCRREIPFIAAAYDKFHAKGFEVLGVSLDKADGSENLAQFTKANHMAWPQIYDASQSALVVAKLYQIEPIPHAFLVDGDTGMILAEGDSIRSEGLAPAIESALAKRQ